MLLFLWYRWELGLSLALIVLGLLIPPLKIPGAGYLRRLARRRWLAITFVGLVAGVGCVGLTIARGPPQPAIHDEFSYLLQADTFAHGRLANPSHPCSDFLDTIHVLQHPTYASKYPPGQALFLAAGQILSGQPALGVGLSFVAACCAVCWMLQAWLPPRWALAGALLLTLRLLIVPAFTRGLPANNWAHGYWGGAVAMLGGALLFGAGRRLFLRPDWTQAAILGASLVVLANSRPFEGLITCLPMLALLAWRYLASGAAELAAFAARVVLPCLCVLAAAFGWMGYYNHCVTGDWRTFPYTVHLKQYIATPVFCWRSPPEPPRYSHPELEKFYVGWDREEWEKLQSCPGWLSATRLRLGWFAQYYFGWLLMPFLVCGVFYRRFWPGFANLTCLILIGAGLLVTWFQPQYFASIAGLLAYLVTTGVRRVWHWQISGRPRGRTVLQFTALAYLFLTVACIAPVAQIQPAGWQFVRAHMLAALRSDGQRHLVLVRYGSDHEVYMEWVFNGAELDRTAVVWAREPSAERLPELLHCFPNRQLWLLEADVFPLKLRRFKSAEAPTSEGS